MPSIGVEIAIIQHGRVLLTQRDDFEVWCLPGGAIEDGESLEQAVAREAFEETGLQVRLTHLVGIYSQPSLPRGGHHFALFAAEPISWLGISPVTRLSTIRCGPRLAARSIRRRWCTCATFGNSEPRSGFCTRGRRLRMLN